MNQFEPIKFNETTFISACEKGNIDLTKKILEINPTIDISANDEEAFVGSCCRGHLDICKWLFEIKPTINISIRNNEALYYACWHGHLDVAKWLYEINPTINISAYNYDIFKLAYDHGHLEVARWLFEINPTINIPKYKVVFESELEVCPICCVSKCDTITFCNHYYCSSCINSWLDHNHTSCPTCRSIINGKFRKLILV